MFSKAKVLAAKPTAAKKKEKLEVEIAGVQDLAKLKALIVAATAMAATIEAEVKSAGFDQFMEMKGNSPRPTSFVGIEGVATCSVEMRKRSTASALNEDEVNVLAKHNLSPFEQVKTQHLFAINPKYAEDETLLAKVEKALSKIVPEDFIVQQEGVSTKVVTDEMLDQAFRMSGTEEAIAIMTTMALKPKLSEEYSMENLIKDATEIMSPKKKVSKLPMKKIA
jgi:hypothetical protein